MSRRLDDLSDRFRPLAEELIRRAVADGIPVRIIDTRRTPEEHAANLAAGVSWTRRSKHLDGDAIDLCPTALLATKGWSPRSPLWARLADIGRGLGLRCGYDWKVKDCGHFEYVPPIGSAV